MAGEELTELEAFFEKFPEGCEYDDEIDVIISWIDQIAERGALERYFRPEGNYGDEVGVIPIDVGINSDCIACACLIRFTFLVMEV